MKITVQKLLNFVGSIQNYQAKVQMKVKPDGKLNYALKKNLKIFEDLIERVNNKIEDMRIDRCSVDDKDNILRGDNNSYKFKKDQLKALNVDLAAYMKIEVDMPEPYYVDSTLFENDDEAEAFELITKKKGKEVPINGEKTLEPAS